MIPEPRRGGTFLYCPWYQNWCGGSRMRTLAQYRRHWRRNHDLQRPLPSREPELAWHGYDSTAERENMSLIEEINERLRGKRDG